MNEENLRQHYFELPGKTGVLSLELKNECFPGLSDDQLYQFGKLLSDFLYGLLLENPEMRDNSLNIFQSILKDAAISIEGKDIDSLLKYSNRAFRNGDYQNSLFLSQLILSRINQIIDKKIENNDRLIDKDIIHLQISTLNFIGYLFSKLGENVDYGLKLTKIANTLLDEFDEDNDDTIALRTAILDTLGSLYIIKKDWKNAIISLNAAHECDRLLISHDAGWYRVGEGESGKEKIRPFTTIPDNLIPALKAAGLTNAELHKLFVDNPAKAFTIGVRKK